MKRFLQVTVALIAVFLIIWNLPSWGKSDTKAPIGIDYFMVYNSESDYKTIPIANYALASSVPTNTNQLTNGSGFLTGYTETDPLFNTKFAAKSTTDLLEGNKLFYTDTRARNAITLTTTGSGAATYNASTGALIIPNNSAKFSTPYSGTTTAAGTYTVTFPVAYSVPPNVQANIINGLDSQNIRTTSVTSTGVTVLVRNRVDVVGLLPTWVNVSGATVDLIVTAK